MMAEINQYGIVGWIAFILSIPLTIGLISMVAKIWTGIHDKILDNATRPRWKLFKVTESGEQWVNERDPNGVRFRDYKLSAEEREKSRIVDASTSEPAYRPGIGSEYIE